MIRNDLSYEEALALPEPKSIWLDGARVIVDDSPEVNVPLSVAGWQARIALHEAGLLEVVDNYIASSDDARLKYKWSYAGNIERNDPSVLAVGAAIGLSQVDLDNLFVQAAKIV